MATCLVLGVHARDADAPGFYDLHLDTAKLERRLRGEPCLARLSRKMNMSQAEVLAHFTPGAYVTLITSSVELNAGYDPDFDEGQLEVLIWNAVSKAVIQFLTDWRSAKQRSGS